MDALADAERYYDNLAYEGEYFDFMCRLMEEQRKETVERIGKTLCSEDLADTVAKILSSAYEFGCPEAEKIADKLGLNQMDFLAIEKNYQEFEKEYERDCQDRSSDYDINE